ncbi:MAG: hypothetical protein N2V75_06580 [Methanophagales archaeon]|nr:hypothetical protein [Methanophagales archaeon]
MNLVPSSDKRGIPIEEAIELINRRIVDSVVQEILREERYSLRDERKQPWSMRTMRPFRGVIDKVIPTLKEELELAERVVMELGLPWGTSNRGDEIFRITGNGFESHELYDDNGRERLKTMFLGASPCVSENTN